MPYVMQSKGQQQNARNVFQRKKKLDKLEFYNQVLTPRHAEAWPVTPLSLVPFTPSSRPVSEPPARNSVQFEMICFKFSGVIPHPTIPFNASSRFACRNR